MGIGNLGVIFSRRKKDTSPPRYFESPQDLLLAFDAVCLFVVPQEEEEESEVGDSDDQNDDDDDQEEEEESDGTANTVSSASKEKNRNSNKNQDKVGSAAVTMAQQTTTTTMTITSTKSSSKSSSKSTKSSTSKSTKSWTAKNSEQSASASASASASSSNKTKKNTKTNPPPSENVQPLVAAATTSDQGKKQKKLIEGESGGSRKLGKRRADAPAFASFEDYEKLLEAWDPDNPNALLPGADGAPPPGRKTASSAKGKKGRCSKNGDDKDGISVSGGGRHSSKKQRSGYI